MDKRFLNIFLLISLAGFLVLPKICLADDFENITLEELSKYLELPEKDANKLMDTLRQVFTTEVVLLWSSGDAPEEKIAVAVTLLKVVKMQALSHLLVDAPIEITWKIIKGAVEMSRIFLDPYGVSVVLDKFERETVKRAIEYGMDFLVGNELRVTPGAIKFKYYSYKGGEKEITLQYVMIYKPDRNNKRAEVEIRFYMPNPIEAPAAEKYGWITSLTVPDLKKDLSPFIVEIKGIVEKDAFDNYLWINETGEVSHPSVNITFPPTVPDLGIKPLTMWEKYVLKPIETTIKEVEIIITKVTGKSPKLVEIWNEIKSFLSKIKLAGPATVVEGPKIEEEAEIEEEIEEIEETPVEIGREVGQEVAEPEIEPKLTLEEIEERLKNIRERVERINEKMEELRGTKEEEIKEEEEEEPEEETPITICEITPGTLPARNKVIINEVAWMGTSASYNDEWIELKNISGNKINLAGWQLLNKDQKIKIIFNERGSTPYIVPHGFWLLERTDDDSVPGVQADLIYTGGLKNSDEALYLFDENCQLRDKVLADPDWPAGDNSSKRTMERKSDLSWQTWQTSASPGGTPKRENSSGYVENPVFVSGGGYSPPPSYPKILISEIQIANENSEKDDFVELFNLNSEDIDLTNWYLQRKTKTGSDFSSYAPKSLFSEKKILAKNYFLIANASSTFSADTTTTHPLTEDNTLYLKNPNGEIVDKVGWGAAQDYETATTSNPEVGKSIGRKWSSTTENYIDTDNNQNDFEIQTPTPKSQNQSPQPTPNQSPIAKFTYTPSDPIVNQEIIFDASSSTDDGTITNYIWDFGDNTTSSIAQATTTHSFASSADFIVTLWVVDNLGVTSSPATTTVSVVEKTPPEENEPPVALFTYAPLAPIVNQEIIFDASSSTDKDGTITSYIWDFGDGATSTGTTTGYIFSTAGTSTITLLVIDNRDATSSTSTVITISEQQQETPSLEVVINEIAWMGTKANSADEWIELYNNTTSTIDITNWRLVSSDQKPDIIFSTTTGAITTTIPAGGFYLIERTDDQTTSESADWVGSFGSGTGMGLGNNPNCEILYLYDQSDNLIDQTVCLENSNWPAGDNSTKQTMERISATTTGATSTNWANNNLIIRNGLDAKGNKINGTPKNENSVSKAFTEISGEIDFPTLTYLGNPYIVKWELTISLGKTLIIEPGVVIKFYDGYSGMKVEGTLKAIGTEEKKIIFTSFKENPAPGDWRQIYFSPTSIDSELVNVRVEYGGEWATSDGSCHSYRAAIRVENSLIILKDSILADNKSKGLYLINSSSTIDNVQFLNHRVGCSGSVTYIYGDAIALWIEGSSPTVKHSTFKKNTTGIVIQNGASPVIENNIFEENEKPIFVYNSYPSFMNNQATNNNLNGILVFNTTLTQNTTWQADLPYIIDGTLTVSQNVIFTLEPGVVIKFRDSNSEMTVDGTLKAIGGETDDKKIIFTSYNSNPQAGDWKQIYFSPESSHSEPELISELINVRVEYGGEWPTAWGCHSYRAAIRVKDTSIILKDSILENNKSRGLYLINSSSTIDNVQFLNHQVGCHGSSTYIYGDAIALWIEGGSPTIKNSTFKNNYCGIYIQSGSPTLENLTFGENEEKNNIDIYPIP